MPQRLRLLFAKALVLAVMAFVAGVITMFPSFWLGQLVLATADATPIEVSLGDPNVLRAVSVARCTSPPAGCSASRSAPCLRHTAGAITVAIGIVFVLPIVSNFLPGTWGDNVGKVLNAGGAITNTRPNVDDQLAPWTGYAVFSLWWIVLLAAAAVLMRRRDA